MFSGALAQACVFNRAVLGCTLCVLGFTYVDVMVGEVAPAEKSGFIFLLVLMVPEFLMISFTLKN